ncbi:hypothetical protein Tco_0604357 [Tanacetum coccineum]
MPEDPIMLTNRTAYEFHHHHDFIPGLVVSTFARTYIPGPEEPQSPPPLDFVPEPMYLEYMPQEDEILQAEEQPLPAASPTADSPGYVPESDPEEEPERNRMMMMRRRRRSLPEMMPMMRMRTRTRMRRRRGRSTQLWPILSHLYIRLLALTTPQPSPLTPLSSPLPHIPSPPLPASLPASVLPALPPASPIRLLGYRAAMIWLRAETPSTSHPLPLPTSSPPLQLLSSDRRIDRPEITLPPRKRLGVDLGPRYEIGEGSSDAAARPTRGCRAYHGFVSTIDTEIRRQRAEEVGYGIRDVWEQDTQDIYVVIGDTRDRQTQIYQSVETLVDDSQYHYKTTRLLDQEALVSREAWGHSIEVSYMTRSEIMTLCSVVMGQQAVISQLQAADRKSQAVTSEMLQADNRRQAEIAALQTFDRTRQEQLV